MLTIKVNKKEAHVSAEGERIGLLAEAVIAFDVITETVAEATGMSYASAALLLYQQAQIAHNKAKEKKNGK
ncbi:MAG: hypothetical protein J6W65_06710 [Oscillospiraceae bacterium]|nr:hypothetical protein [Oscillospiraceae bacterium]MBP5444283.1 hypothetical protein [Treponema sp.]MBQ5337114.1 hypothetical protein [Oscillospiraceae bacterium]